MSRHSKNSVKLSYFRPRQASALLLSFFMMTLLIVVSLGVSFMVSRDVSTVRTMVSGLQSRYAAEGASELGLYLLEANLAGYEPELEDLEFSSGAVASLAVNARESIVPCSVNEEEWRVLAPNESIQLPLYAQVDEFGEVEDIEKFYVEFYVEDARDEDDDVDFPPKDDVLRWKILGFDQRNLTEAISEYIPLDWDNQRFSEENPSIFGSLVNEAVPEGYFYAKFRDAGFPAVYYPRYSIADFLRDHELNTLVLTNVVQRDFENMIYFRMHAADTEAVCEYVTLETTGLQEGVSTQKTLQTVVDEGENLPVFDFVLYNADASDEDEASDVQLTVPDFASDFFPIKPGSLGL